MAEAQPAEASPDLGNKELASLACALLFSSARKKRVFQEIADAIPMGFNATALALFVAETQKVSEPTARRAIRKLKELGLIAAENGFPVQLTELGKSVFSGCLKEGETLEE